MRYRRPGPAPTIDGRVVVASCKLDARTAVRLEHAAAATGVTRSEIVRQAVTAWLIAAAPERAA